MAFTQASDFLINVPKAVNAAFTGLKNGTISFKDYWQTVNDAADFFKTHKPNSMSSAAIYRIYKDIPTIINMHMQNGLDFSKLKPEQLPTQDDIAGGMDLSLFPQNIPLQIQPGKQTTPTTPPTPTDPTQPTVPATPTTPIVLQPQPPAVQPPVDPTQPQPAVPPTVETDPNAQQLYLPPNTPTPIPNVNPSPIPLTLDQQVLDREAQKENAALLAAINQANGIQQNALTNEGNILSGENTALRNSLSEAMGQRQNTWNDYSKLLGQQNDIAMSQMTPDVLESLNSRGLMTSSALGNALAQERSKLQATSENQLAQMGLDTSNYQAEQLMGLGTRQADLQRTLLDQQNSLAQAQAQGLLTTANNTAQMGQAGIQRRFSLADWEKEANLAKTLGSAVTPQVQNSGGFSMTNALTGGAAGGLTAAALGATGPVGWSVAGASALLSGLFGSKSGGK